MPSLTPPCLDHNSPPRPSCQLQVLTTAHSTADRVIFLKKQVKLLLLRLKLSSDISLDLGQILKTPNLGSQSFTLSSSRLSVTTSHATFSLVHHIPATRAFLLLELEALSCLKAFALAVLSSRKALLPPQHKDGSVLSFTFYLKCHLHRNTPTDFPIQLSHPVT